MRSFLFLCVFSLSALLVAGTARAEDVPPPAPIGATVVTPPAPVQPPAPTAPAAAAPAAEARKEEEEQVTIRSAFFKGLFGGSGITKEQAADEITRLRAANADLQKKLDAATAELKAISEDFPAIRAALLAGKPDAPALQTPLGQQVVQATAAAAAAAAGQPAHDPAKLPGPGAAQPDNKPAAAAVVSTQRPTLAQAAAAFWQSQDGSKYNPATAGAN